MKVLPNGIINCVACNMANNNNSSSVIMLNVKVVVMYSHIANNDAFQMVFPSIYDCNVDDKFLSSK